MGTSTPRGNRTHIAIYGRRNAGKSTLLNAITGQSVSLVSDIPGTTTDPVTKPMEVPGIGPAVLIDTAGIDDTGILGDMRVAKTRQMMDRTDLALIVVAEGQTDLAEELELAEQFTRRGIPFIAVANRRTGPDGGGLDPEAAGKAGEEREAETHSGGQPEAPASGADEKETARLAALFRAPACTVDAKRREGIAGLLRLMAERVSSGNGSDTLLDGLVEPGDVVVLVMPQDKQAPKGRLILPQAQVIRELLDRGAVAVAATDARLPLALDSLGRKPDLVITDSQVFGIVDRTLDPDVPLTSFSILFARNKGDLDVFREGAEAIDRLKPGDAVLIAEACTHHPMKGDISREKLPNWLAEKAGGPLDIRVHAGSDFPDDLSTYRLIVHCGACMFNRRQVLSRISRAREAGVPITNHGMAIAKLKGILERATAPFAANRPT